MSLFSGWPLAVINGNCLFIVLLSYFFFLISNLCGSFLCHIAVFFTFLIRSPGLLSDSGAFHVFGIGLTQSFFMYSICISLEITHYSFYLSFLTGETIDICHDVGSWCFQSCQAILSSTCGCKWLCSQFKLWLSYLSHFMHLYVRCPSFKAKIKYMKLYHYSLHAFLPWYQNKHRNNTTSHFHHIYVLGSSRKGRN